MKRSLVLMLVLVLGGCASYFAPPYEAAISDKLTSAAAGVERIGAAIDLAGAAPPGTFAKYEPDHVAVLADLRSARTIAEGRAAIYEGKPSGEAAKIVVNMIGNCDAAVLLVAQRHKTAGLTPSLFSNVMVRETCALSVKSEQLLQP